MEYANQVWESMAENISHIAKETPGVVSTGKIKGVQEIMVVECVSAK